MGASIVLVESVLQYNIETCDLAKVRLANQSFGQFFPSVQIALAFGELVGQLGCVHVRHGTQPHPEGMTKLWQLSIVTLEATALEMTPRPHDGFLYVGRYSLLQRVLIIQNKIEFALAQIHWLIKTENRSLRTTNCFQSWLQVDRIATHGSDGKELLPLWVSNIGIRAIGASDTWCRLMTKDATEKRWNPDGTWSKKTKSFQQFEHTINKPPMSDPMPRRLAALEMRDPSPPDDPPEMRARSYGLHVRP